MSEVIHRMRNEGHKFTAAVVVSGDLGHVRGIITGDQIVDALAHPASAVELPKTPVEKCMLPFPPPLHPNDDITRAAELMDMTHSRHLVVVDNYVPVGIVSQGDILDWFDEQQWIDSNELNTNIQTVIRSIIINKVDNILMVLLVRQNTATLFSFPELLVDKSANIKSELGKYLKRCSLPSKIINKLEVSTVRLCYFSCVPEFFNTTDID